MKCPRCSANFTHSAVPPFCSERCKLLDLGSWAREEYRIEGSSKLVDAMPETQDSGDLPSPEDIENVRRSPRRTTLH